MTNTLLTRPTVDTQLFLVLLALVLLVRGDLQLLPGPDLLQGVQLLSDLLYPPTVDQLVYVEAGPTVRTLRPLLRQPSSDAHVATQLGAMRTEMSVTELLHTDEATEDLGKTFHRMTSSSGLAPLLPPDNLIAGRS